MKPLRFGIDYDDTFTADPALFATFINNLHGAGHRAIIVTARRDSPENREEISAMLEHWECSIGVVFTAMGSKLHVTSKRGIDIDIWIDDDPASLVNGR